MDELLVITGAVVAFVAMLAIYFLPSFIAEKQNRRDWKAIYVLNLLVGWTFIGWIVLVIWSLNGDVKAKNEAIPD